MLEPREELSAGGEGSRTVAIGAWGRAVVSDSTQTQATFTTTRSRTQGQGRGKGRDQPKVWRVEIPCEEMDIWKGEAE